MVEIANRTPAPVAVALAVRPYNLGAFEIEDDDVADIWEWSNLWAIDEITVDGRLLSLDDGDRHGFGLAYVMFDRDPADIVVGSHGTDCAAALESRDGVAVAEGTGSEPASTRAGDAATDPQARTAFTDLGRMPEALGHCGCDGPAGSAAFTDLGRMPEALGHCGCDLSACRRSDAAGRGAGTGLSVHVECRREPAGRYRGTPLAANARTGRQRLAPASRRGLPAGFAPRAARRCCARGAGLPVARDSALR